MAREIDSKVYEWLASAGKEHLANYFAEALVDWDCLDLLEFEDLEKMGLLIGPQSSSVMSYRRQRTNSNLPVDSKTKE